MEWLRGWQMEPTAAGDGAAAMNALWQGVALGRPYALVLLDARMPDMDGLALAAIIRQRAELSGSRIVLLDLGDRPGDLARLRELRIDAHLLKPVQQDELLETIYRVIGRTGDEAAPAWEAAPTPVPATVPLRILVAEDNEFNAQHLEQLLGIAGPPRAAGDQRPGGAGPGATEGVSTCCSWTSTCRSWTASRSSGCSGNGSRLPAAICPSSP